MFETTQLEHRLTKEAFKALEPGLREDLLNAQFEFAEARRRTVLVLVNGPDGAGKGEVANRLYEWLDAHLLVTMTYERPTPAERLHPSAWRYWRDLPAKGQIGIMLGSWYHEVLLARALGKLDGVAFEGELHAVTRFEAMLAAEGIELVKLWLHMAPEELRRELKRARGKDGLTRPVVIEWGDVTGAAARERLVEGALEMVRITSIGSAPWHVVAASDPHYRDASIGAILRDVLQRANAAPAQAVPAPPAVPALLEQPSLLRSLDFSQKLAADEYRTELHAQQARITRLAGSKRFKKHGLICVFEGNDAAGKGGAILRVRQALDPRRFRVHAISAPSDEERARPYLWRFWRRVPELGDVAFFDRSWYGRVLVERVEGFAAEADWRRAYTEINDFEAELARAGYIVVKFWLAISEQEQLSRFEAREKISFKRFKLTPEDWRNREKWPLYEPAVNEMIDRTSTSYAPWTLVEAESKHFARVKVLTTVADRLEAALG